MVDTQRATWFPTPAPAALTPQTHATPRWTNVIQPDALLMGTHAIVPAGTTGMLIGGEPQPMELYDVGGASTYGTGVSRGNWYHAPFVYRGSVAGSLNPPGVAPSSPGFDVDLAGGGAVWQNQSVTFGAFLNGTTLTAATDVSHEAGSVRKCRKKDGTYTNGRWRQYYETVAGSNTVRITHNMRIPTTDPPSEAAGNFTTDLGFELMGFGATLTSSLGAGVLSGYNADLNGQWTGWVAGGGIFVSVRNVARCYPRGFSLDPATGKLRLYIHFENGTRVRAGDYEYDTIAHMRYLHQGKLNLHMPPEYITACNPLGEAAGVGTPGTIHGDLEKEVLAVNAANYTCNHAGITLEIMVAFYDEANGTPDFVAWHAVHEARPIASLVTVPGMKGSDFPEVEEKILDTIRFWDSCAIYHGQFLDGDFQTEQPTGVYNLNRVRLPNHYRQVSITWSNYLRTRDPEVLGYARRFNRVWRDLSVGDYPYTNGTTSQLGFAHGKHLTPWEGSSSQGHWIDPFGLQLAWQIDGDRIAKDKYDLWNPGVENGSAWNGGRNDREIKNPLGQGRQKKDFLGIGYSGLQPMVDLVEAETIATFLAEGSPGVFWHPHWGSQTYWNANPLPVRLNANCLTMVPSIYTGQTDLFHGYLGRLPVEHPEDQMPGPTGDAWLSEQWGEYLEEIRRLGVTSFTPATECGAYPCLPGDRRVSTSYGGVTYITKLDSNPLYIRTYMQQLAGGDTYPASVRVRRPDGTTHTLKFKHPYYNGVTNPAAMPEAYLYIDEPSLDRPSGRGGSSALFTILGPAGTYELIFTPDGGTGCGVMGGFTGRAEYHVFPANAIGSLSNGWFRPAAGQGVPTDPVRIDGVTSSGGIDWVVEARITSSIPRYKWNYGGTFAQELEWLPAVSPTVPAIVLSSLFTSITAHYSFDRDVITSSNVVTGCVNEMGIAGYGDTDTGRALGALVPVNSPIRVTGIHEGSHALRLKRASNQRATLVRNSSGTPGVDNTFYMTYTGDTDFTISVYWKPASLPVSTTQVIAAKGASTLKEWELLLVTDGAGVGTYRFRITDGTSTSGSIDSTVQAVVGTYNHILVWHDKTLNTINIQIDEGTVFSLPWTTGARAGTGDLCVGNYTDNPSAGANAADGDLDNLGFWAKVFSVAERSLVADNTWPF